jgi:hypothetical protein
VLAAILAFDRDHHGACMELLERCAHLSREQIDDQGGLHSVLSADEMLEADVGGAREARRAERGFVPPTMAAAFLRAARGSAGRETPYTEHDPTTRAYLRELARAPAKSHATPPLASAPDLSALLGDAGITQPALPPLLGGRPGQARPAEPLVVSALRRLAETAPERFAERGEELAYLANVLLGGCLFDGRRLRPFEAVEHALDSVSLGLCLAAGDPELTPARAARLLERYPADGLFRLALQRAAELPLDAASRQRLQGLLKSIRV